MAELSDEVYLQIKNNPLQPRIGNVPTSLRSALKSNEAESPAIATPSSLEDEFILGMELFVSIDLR